MSGWVNQQVTFWDDGAESNVYIHDVGSTLGSHVKFTGSATIAPGYSAGYVLHIEALNSDGLTIHQNRDNGPAALQSYLLAFREQSDLDFIQICAESGAFVAVGAPVDLCAAGQGVYEVRDPAGAAAYYAGLGVAPGEVIGLLGVAGGFSLLQVNWHVEAGTVGVLGGSIPALGHPSGKALRDDFVRAQPWIGPMIYGGAAAIPLRRAYDRLVDDRVALLGDAGCQVFAAHGSGIGAGLVAAKLLAATLTGGGDLRGYEVAWHRRWGGIFAAYDAARRMSQGMDRTQLADAVTHGLIDHAMIKAGLDQELPRISPAMLAARLRAVRRAPTMTWPLVRAVAQMGAVQALSGLYPRDVRAADLWTRAMNRVLAV